MTQANPYALNSMTASSSFSMSCALVLEDDLMVAAGLCDVIESEGLPTLLVSGNDSVGAEALIRHGHLLAIAVVDVSRPRDMTYALLDLLRGHGIPAVCVSTTPSIEWPAPYASLPLFIKPFDMNNFRQVLREMAAEGIHGTHERGI